MYQIDPNPHYRYDIYSAIDHRNTTTSIKNKHPIHFDSTVYWDLSSSHKNKIHVHEKNGAKYKYNEDAISGVSSTVK